MRPMYKYNNKTLIVNHHFLINDSLSGFSLFFYLSKHHDLRRSSPDASSVSSASLDRWISSYDLLARYFRYTMAIKSSGTDRKTQNSMFIFIVIGLSCFFYGLGAWQKSGFGKGDSIALTITKQTDCMGVLSNLNYETHHDSVATNKDNPHLKPIIFKSCDKRFTDYTPCQDRKRSMKLSRANMFYRERHCPSERGRLYCLIPAPKGYVTPFPWPKSRDYVAFANVPHKTLTIEKAVQNWVQYEGDVFRFPGGGTQFPQGADKYIDQLASVIPFDSGMIRTALDTGCGVLFSVKIPMPYF